MKPKVIVAFVVAMLLSGGAFAQTRHDSAVFMVDVSQTTGQGDLTEQAVKITRDMNARFPGYVQSAGAMVFGNEAPPTTAWPAEVMAWDRAKLDSALSGIVNGGGPTPMGYAVNMAGMGVAKAQGKVALIIVSDGKNNGRTDPAAAVKALKDKYGDNLCVFAIQLGDCPIGKGVLEQMVSAGGCGKLANASELQSDAGVQGLVDYIFPPETAAAPPPPPPPPPKATPKDSDGDGVMDLDDKCPKTPRGANVDARGCWVIENIRFASGNAVIQAEYYDELDNVAEVLKKNPGLDVVIEGHTDSQGDEAMNQDLSQRRAQAVVDYLKGKGVDASKISASGKGESQPIADNETPEGRAQNRRIEITVK